MNALEVKNRNHEFVTRKVVITADRNGHVPTRIEVMRAGEWPDDSNKGFLSISRADLLEIVDNFNNGIGLAGGTIADGSPGLPIDFMHEEWGKAAGWIKGLVVEGDVLYADPVDWTKAGREALEAGEFKLFSPAFYPGCLGSWHDPEDWSITAQNVLTGGGLTNIPFFKDLKPIMASNSSQSSDDKNVIYISASAKENNMLTLEEVRAKDASALTDEEKDLLVEHKAELSKEELVKFGFETDEAQQPETQTTETKTEEPKVETPEAKDTEEVTVPTELQPIMASLKSGESVVVKASELASLKETAAQYQTDKAEQLVQRHIERGAIVADQKSKWVERLVKASGAARKELEDILEGMNGSPVMADRQGKTEEAGDATTAIAEVQQKAEAMIKAAREAGETLAKDEAYSRVLKADSALADRYKLETKVS